MPVQTVIKHTHWMEVCIFVYMCAYVWVCAFVHHFSKDFFHFFTIKVRILFKSEDILVSSSFLIPIYKLLKFLFQH